jgi:hypothetical protein
MSARHCFLLLLALLAPSLAACATLPPLLLIALLLGP